MAEALEQSHGAIPSQNPEDGQDAAENVEKEQKHVQMSLFRKPEEVIMDKLRKVDISTTTPLDALNLLSKLKEKAQKIDN